MSGEMLMKDYDRNVEAAATFGVPSLYTTYGACKQVYHEKYDMFCVLGVIYQNTEELWKVKYSFITNNLIF